MLATLVVDAADRPRWVQRRDQLDQALHSRKGGSSCHDTAAVVRDVKNATKEGEDGREVAVGGEQSDLISADCQEDALCESHRCLAALMCGAQTTTFSGVC